MQCPLTNQRPQTITIRLGEIFGQGDPMNHSCPSRHVDQSHEGLQGR